MKKDVDKGAESWYYMQAVGKTAMRFTNSDEKTWKKLLTDEEFDDTIRKFRAEPDFGDEAGTKHRNVPCKLNNVNMNKHLGQFLIKLFF